MDLAGLRDEEVDEVVDVLGARGEGRDPYGDDLEAIEQVLAERAPLDGGLQIRVRRCDDANVRALRLRRAEREVLERLEELQELRLRVQRKSVDLVEEERAAVGSRHLAEDAVRGRRVSARHGPEELALDELLGERGAAHLDERLAACAGCSHG